MKTDLRLHVVAAVIEGQDGRVLLALRPTQAHQGGMWEFPGGKVEHGESVRDALVRELREELGIYIEAARPLIRIQHDYPDLAILLDVWRVSSYSGEPAGMEGQTIKWVSQAQLTELVFPPANQPVIKAVQLPSCYMITPEPGDHEPFLRMLQRKIENGITLMQLRATGLDTDSYRDLAREVIRLCRATQTRLLLNSTIELALELAADGVHLNSRRLMAANGRDLPAELLLAASCHTREEVLHANGLGVDFMVVSPVLATASHPQAQPLGWEGFRALSELAVSPVYALGGMTREHLEQAYIHGGQGIAGIGTFRDERDRSVNPAGV